MLPVENGQTSLYCLARRGLLGGLPETPTKLEKNVRCFAVVSHLVQGCVEATP